ncbi:hypothetical protein FDG2_2284 [Candidatus Protofrankia californiensis]|uniref:Protein kinase domain-containing protein n=1 Tax=Candidatus Protofrankia californiensis TaxID=1839754 RepID=A0A1C3NXB6_9ACTN|nr:hypothetical protein FDG2_2284 [Candidatus Protofrankia californiensis]
MPARRDLEAGDTFAGYTIESIRGSGSFGTVYVALESRMGVHRRVALKVIAPGSGVDGFVGRKRFLREAEVLCTISHPHIITLHDAGEQDGLLYLAMQLMANDLDREIRRRGRLPAAMAGDIASQVASALNAAHERDVIHRDIKPANILLYQDESTIHAYLADFGLARHASATRLTATGSSPGTYLYMAPEQLDGEEATQASDIYAVGLLLHEMMFGFPRCRDEKCQQLAAEPVAARLHAITRQACEAKPDARYPDAAALHRDIAAVLDGQPITAPPRRATQVLARVQPVPGPLASGYDLDPAPSLDFPREPSPTNHHAPFLSDPGQSEDGLNGQRQTFSSWMHLPGPRRHAESRPVFREGAVTAVSGAGDRETRIRGGRKQPAARRRPAPIPVSVRFLLVIILIVAVVTLVIFIGPIMPGTKASHAAPVLSASPAQTNSLDTPSLGEAPSRSQAPATTGQPSGLPVPRTQHPPAATSRPLAPPIPPSASLNPPAVPAVASSTVRRRYVCATDASLRSSYGSNTQTIAVLRHGDEFDADGQPEENGWMHGYAPSVNLSGWVLSKYVKTACTTS